jgi:hypothetical protein
MEQQRWSFGAYPFVGLLTGFGPAATINSEPLSDLTLPFRHPVD